MSVRAFDKPPSLQPSARVALLAPSSPFDRARFDAGAALLGTRYDVGLGDALFARHGYFAGRDGARLADLTSALHDPRVRALLPVRGGYGATRLLPALSVAQVRGANAWLVGFSDITALHALWAQAGLCSIHGPMVCSLPEASSALQQEWFRLLEGEPASPLTGLHCLRPGRAQGRLFGGNLTVLAALVGTPYLPSLQGTLLILEDVNERPYRIDRTLTTMLQAGVFEGVVGVVLGQFSQCEPGPDGVSVAEVLEERLGTLGVPIAADAPFGHVAENWPIVLGATAALDCDAGALHYT